ncbi:YihY/virulence factor BrkB family protein [Jiella mangrovi]|uniref:YihY/virulence factor BrkB family protein n=1 Tax=Jiella mangrovi TaxID=2821407 RepID=A0ABS4BMA9_9HYPH|nr:YihY/virulence factor BrkB family protein [Jiella mangrovi]MBP0617815.1 YihY/virulence factor BrkB family protein [Jiella mangrovi]
MADSARGLDAASPGEIPPAGWKDVLWRIYQEISDDRVMLIAAGVTYYLLLAMVPALSALVSVYGLFADPSTIQQQISMLSSFVPGGGMDIIGEQLTRLSQQDNATLGVTFVISLALALWSANAGMKALFEAMNVAYDEHEERGFVKLTLISLAFTLAAVVSAILFIVVVVLLPIVLEFVGLGQSTEWLVRIASYVGMAVVVSLAVASLYRWGPCRANAQWKWITPGVILTMMLVMIVSVLFSWYVANFGSYNKTYGSLGALIGFMTWIWISSTILIIGGELNSEMEHQTARDTTTGPERPLGQRGAYMADHVAGDGRRGSDREQSTQDRKWQEPASRRPKRVSAGTLALAIPATLLLAAMQRRSKTS